MGVIYRGEFDSLSGVAWKIDIHDLLYSSTVGTFTPGTGGFQLSYKGITERNDPVLASTLNVPFIVRTAADEGFIQTLMSAQEERYTVIVYRNTAIYWIGVMLPDEVQREDSAYPYEVELTFTDGLSRLKDLDYNNSGTAYTGRATLLAHILNALNRCGTATHYGATDVMLTTKINWYSTTHTYVSNRCPLAYTDLSHSVFYEYDDKGTVQYKSCYDVLDTILRAFNARIEQVSGVYTIYQVQDMTNFNGYFRSFDKAGTPRSSGISSFRSTVTDSTRKAGAVYRYMQPLREVSKTYKARVINSSNGSLLPVQSKYETQVGLIMEVYTSGYYPVITFSGTIHDWYSGPTYSTGFKTKFDIVIRKVKLSDSSVQYLSGSNISANPSVTTWSNTSTVYAVWTPLKVGDNWDRYTTFSFTTPLLLDDASFTFEMDMVSHYTANTFVYTLPVGSVWGYECQDFIAELSYNGEDREDEEIEYKSVNTLSGGGSVASTAKIQLPDTEIGDGPYSYSLGKLRVQSSLGVWSDSTFWKVKNSGPAIKLHQLSVEQVLKGQKVPIGKIQAAWVNSALNGASALVLGTAVYVPMMVTIDPERDEVSGEWYNCIIP